MFCRRKIAIKASPRPRIKNAAFYAKIETFLAAAGTGASSYFLLRFHYAFLRKKTQFYARFFIPREHHSNQHQPHFTAHWPHKHKSGLFKAVFCLFHIHNADKMTEKRPQFMMFSEIRRNHAKGGEKRKGA